MRIKTMNRKINQNRLEMRQVLGEFRLKLDNYLRSNIQDSCYTDVDCVKVCIKVDGFLSSDDIKGIEENFLLELNKFEECYSHPRHIVAVRYIFDHKKTP